MTEKIVALQRSEAELRALMYEIRDELTGAMGLHVGCNPMEWYLPGQQKYSDARPKTIFAFRFRFYRSSFRGVHNDYFDVVVPTNATPQQVVEMAIDIMIDHQTPDY